MRSTTALGSGDHRPRQGKQKWIPREHEHRAGAAEEEARAKAAEADRLRAEADQHRSTVDDQRRDMSRMEQAAEKLDPRHRASDSGHDRRGDVTDDGRGGAPGRHAQREESHPVADRLTGNGDAHRRGGDIGRDAPPADSSLADRGDDLRR